MKDIAINPVRVDAGGGKSQVLQTVAELGEFLLYKWRRKGGMKYHLAKVACLEAIAQEQTPEQARDAFLEACSEANIFVFPDDGRPEPRTKGPKR